MGDKHSLSDQVTPPSSAVPIVPTDEDAVPDRYPKASDGDDGQGPASDPNEDEEDTGGVEEDGKGDGPPVPPQPE